MKLTLSTAVLMALIVITCSAQKLTPIELLNHYCKRMGLQYNQSPGFQEVKRPFTAFWPGKGSTIISATDYKIKPDNADVMIAIGFYDLDSTGWAGKKPSYKYSDNNQIIGIRSLIDSPRPPEDLTDKINMDLDTNKVKFFKDDELKKYGATYGGIAEIPMDKAYWKQYWKLRVLFLYKKIRARFTNNIFITKVIQ